MKRLKKTGALIVLSMVLCLAGCGDKERYQTDNVNGDASDLGDIQLCVRENGSGTRNEFEEYLDIESVVDGKDMYLEWEDIIIAEDSESVKAVIGTNASAIGYVSYGQLDDTMKALSVDNIICSAESIESEAYPLTRDFSVAWSGQTNTLQDDFLRYINGAGQDIVKEDYIAVNKSGTFLYDKEATGRLTISGSSSVAPLIQELADSYMEINPNAEISVITSDSTQGLNDMLQGKYDFAMVSRDLESYERELVEVNVFARDGIAVVVQKDNPINNVSKDQLKNIFTGELKSWSNVK